MARGRVTKRSGGDDATARVVGSVGSNSVRLRRVGIDTYQQPVIYMHRDCPVCRSEGFEAHSRVRVDLADTHIIATLNVVMNELVERDEAGLSEVAWRLLGAVDGDRARLSHPDPLLSLSHVRAKIYGHQLGREELADIVRDVVAGRLSDVHLAAFLTACAMNRLSPAEMQALTETMIDAGDRLRWDHATVMDKHCIGGLPGNRTTLVIVPIVAAAGLLIPKTSSRAITSPAGTADAMETLAPVDVTLKVMRKVVEREGGCIVWGGSVRLSPADDVMIRVERALDLDSEGQLVASVLSKKVAAGSTSVVIDIPVGPTAKVRTNEQADSIATSLRDVGRAVGLNVRIVPTDGQQPVGHGIGPALEARDALAILRGEDAPADLRDRSLMLAGAVLELGGAAGEGHGIDRARELLESGAAWSKMQAICESQGGMREPPKAPHRRDVVAATSGRVANIDNRRLARLAKLAGAPRALAAGVLLHARLGSLVNAGDTLFTIHAEAPGELEYAHHYADANRDLLQIQEPI